MPLLKDKIALVTGAGGGIGRETVKCLVDHGAIVVVTDRDVAAGNETVDYAGGADHAIFVEADVADPAGMQHVVERTLAAYGRLDIAHNNAGIELNGPFLADVTPEQFDRIIRVNLGGVFLSMRAEIPAMLAGGGGSIINTSSGLGKVGLAGQSSYVASKHGVIGLTESAALEYSSQGVRVNAVLPGVIRTPMLEGIETEYPGFIASVEARHPIGRLGTPREIANTVAWLGSDMASFVTGASFAVDGGFLAQ